MRNIKKSCKVCGCFDAFPGVRELSEPLNGYCRRKPPRVVVYEEEPDCLWPIVSEGDWCIEGFIEIEEEVADRGEGVGSGVGKGCPEPGDSSSVVWISRGTR